MKKRFILLVDIKEQARSLLKFAGQWAKAVNAELLIVHQVHSMAPGIGEAEVRRDIKRHERRQALAALTSFVIEVLGDSVVTKFYVTNANLEAAIYRLQSSQTLDIIFVGLKSKNWLQRIFLPNTAVRLYNEINKILLALPEDFQGDGFENIQVAVNPKFPVNEEAFRQLLSIMPAFIKHVTLFSVLKSDEADEEVIAYLKLLTSLFIPVISVNYEIVRAEDVADGIMNHIRSEETLLVLQKGTRELTDYFRPYLVNSILQLSRMPVIILP